MKGYKMLNANMTAMYGSMTYEVGKTYELKEEIIPCKQGFHFCEELTDCLYYYPNLDNSKRFFEIETGDNIIEKKDKCVTDEITLIRELSLEEILQYIRENKNKVNWKAVCRYQKLSEEFIQEFQDRVDWNCISEYQKLSEEFIREFADRVDWDYISSCQKISEDFIREFKDELDWDYLSFHQVLSEDFIREFKNRVNWVYIGEYQELSEDFIREFEYRLSL